IAWMRAVSGAIVVVGEGALGGRDRQGIIVIVEDTTVGGGHILRSAQRGAGDGGDRWRHIGEGHSEGGADRVAVSIGRGDGHCARIRLITSLRPAPGAIAVVGEAPPARLYPPVTIL